MADSRELEKPIDAEQAWHTHHVPADLAKKEWRDSMRQLRVARRALEQANSDLRELALSLSDRVAALEARAKLTTTVTDIETRLRSVRGQ